MTREEYEAKKVALLEEIEQAFGSVERDSGVTEYIKNLSDYNVPDKDHLLNAGMRWQDVPRQWIQEADSFLIYLDAPSFRFYLPTYLTWFLRFMDYESDEEHYFSSSTFHSVLHILTIYEGVSEFILEKYSQLTPEQEKTVAHFLVFQCQRFVFLYAQEEARDANSDYFTGYRGEWGYKRAYERCQGILQAHWGQFLGSGFVEAEFPFPGPSRRWRNMIARRKVIEPHRLEAYEARKRALMEEIDCAFDGVEREDGLTLHEASAMDDYASPEELAEARLLDTETRWQDVSDRDIQWGHMSLIYLDEKGFHYYLPAYLVWYLRFVDHEEEYFHSDTFGAVDFALGIHSELDLADEALMAPIRQLESLLGTSLEDWDDPLHVKFNAFSNEQKRAIAHFVQFRHEQLDYRVERLNIPPEPDLEEEEESWAEERHRDVQRAMVLYWGRFL